MIKRFALMALVPLLFLGCVAAPHPPVEPSIFDFPRAEEVGPADYVYARARNEHDEMLVTERMVENLQDAIERNEARRDYYLDLVAEVRNTRTMDPVSRQARYDTYLSEVFYIEEEIRGQHDAIGMLRSHYSLMAGKIRRDTLRGRQIEKGIIPPPAY